MRKISRDYDGANNFGPRREIPVSLMRYKWLTARGDVKLYTKELTVYLFSLGLAFRIYSAFVDERPRAARCAQ